jgi:hypothetical protein
MYSKTSSFCVIETLILFAFYDAETRRDKARLVSTLRINL